MEQKIVTEMATSLTWGPKKGAPYAKEMALSIPSPKAHTAVK